MTRVESFEETEFGEGAIVVDDVKITYMQNGDNTEKEDSVQTITLSTRNNGVARFINIKTSNWSVDDINDLKVLLEDFEKRASIINDKK